MKGYIDMIKELLEFARSRKQFLIAFIITIFMLLGAFIVFSETSVLAPLIYTVF